MRPSEIARTAGVFAEAQKQRGLLASVEPTGLRKILLEEQRRNRMFEDLSRPSSLRMILDQQLKVSHLLESPTYLQMGQQTKILAGLGRLSNRRSSIARRCTTTLLGKSPRRTPLPYRAFWIAWPKNGKQS
jgi:hypothetical protein